MAGVEHRAVIALDTNILVYARRSEAPHHRKALALLREFAAGERPWALTWVSIYEFLRVVTHPRVFNPPTELTAALEDVESLLDSPSLQMLGEGPSHAKRMRRTLLDGMATGNLVHDGHIATLLLEHGVTEFWTADRDFSRFRGVAAVDPFR
jgi:toxin-antitoxin system PIN domain toxin